MNCKFCNSFALIFIQIGGGWALSDRWHRSRRPVTMLLHEVPRLWNRNDCHDAERPLKRTGRHRRVRRLPSVLVRSFRKPGAVSRFHAEAHEVYRGTLDTGEAVAAGRAPLPPVRDDAAAGARHPAKHAVHLLAMRDR